MSQELKIKINDEGDVLREADDKHLALVDLESGEVKFSNPAYAKEGYKEPITALADKAVELVKAGKTASEANEKATDEKPPVETPPDDEVVTQSDPRVPSSRPPKDPSLGNFSAAHINFDHANLSDEEFGKKYQSTAQCQLDFIGRRPHLFADQDGLEERLVTLITA